MRAAAILLIALSAASMVSAASENCVHELPNGKFIDLSAVEQAWTVPYVVSGTSYTLYFTPCGTLAYSTLMPETNAYCKDDSLGCNLLGTATTGSPQALIAITQNSVTWANSTTGGAATINLNGGTFCPANNNYRQMTITLTCAATAGVPTWDREVSCHYYVRWSHPAGCAVDSASSGGSGGGLSGGDVFLIIFFVGGFLYVACGYAYMYKFKEARGVEAVPNIEFWRGLPGLVKDGAVYSVEKVKGLFSKSG